MKTTDDQNGYDYDLLVWVQDGMIQVCGHPASMRTSGPCCTAWEWQNQPVDLARRDSRETGTRCHAGCTCGAASADCRMEDDMNNGYTIYPYVVYPSGTAAATLRAAREIAQAESRTAQGCPARIKSSRTNKVVTTYEDGRES